MSTEAAAEHALTWLVEGFGHVAEPRAVAEAELRRLKAICEISFVSALLSECTEGKRLNDAIAPMVRSAGEDGRFLKALWHQPQHANLYLPLVYARGCQGDLEAKEWSDLRTILRRLQRLRKERPPFRTLDFLYSLFLLTGDEAFRRRMTSVAEAGTLGTGAGLPTFTRGDEYALTHGIFYLTGFGAWRWPFGEQNCHSTLAVLRALSLEADAERNWDLYAEYRIAEAMLKPEDPAIGTSPLLSSQRDDGSWPGPADLSPVLHREGFEDADEIGFYHDYHTTLVAWMALILPPLRLNPQPLKPPPLHPPAHARARYPGLPDAWVNLPASFSSLVGSSGPLAPDEVLHREPQGVLPWLEWWYWCRQLDPATVAPLLPLGSDLDGVMSDAAMRGSWRLLRCTLLASEIGGETGTAERRIVKSLESALAKTTSSDLLSAPSVDRLVALALLARKAHVASSSYHSFRGIVDQTMLMALLHRDVFVLAPLLAFTGAWTARDLRHQATTLLEEALAQSLPFGFVDGASPEVQRRCVGAECYLEQIALAARLESSEENLRDAFTEFA